MKILIIEDETLAADRLEWMIRQYEPKTEVLGRLESVEEAIRWFRTQPTVDLIFMDIHLADGACFSIFEQSDPGAPIIFTTAYDQYALDAFKVMSVDYLLKPVTAEDLASAIKKWEQFRKPTMIAPEFIRQLTAQAPGQVYKQRFLGKVGQKTFFIATDDIKCFVAENKIVYLLGGDGFKYVVEYTLEQLEQLLDPARFFRINRSVIVHVEAIEQVKPYLNSRLKLKLKQPTLQEEDLVISRERVPQFRQWAEG
jgi:DNA-binding LytR/AlgR family response regulator